MKLTEDKKMKTHITEFVAALKDFVDWACREDTPVVELNDKEDIKKALAEGNSRFSVPFIYPELLQLSWFNKTGFWVGDIQVSPLETSNILDCGFEFYTADDKGECYMFKDFFNDVEMRVEWDLIAEAIEEDMTLYNR